MYVKDSKVDLTQNNLLLFEERRKIISYNYRQLDDFQLSGVSGGKKKFDCAATFVTGITAGIGSGTITGLAGGPFWDNRRRRSWWKLRSGWVSY